MTKVGNQEHLSESEPLLLTVVIMAYNEADNIIACLTSVAANVQGLVATKLNPFAQVECLVVANGCRDNTAELARQFSEQFARLKPSVQPWVKVFEIERGDKANAWNRAVHQYSKPSQYYVFLDGDCVAQPNAIAKLIDELNHDIKLNACSAVPSATLSLYRQEMVNKGGIAGCLYALSGQFVQRIKQQKIKMPIGFIGDDSLVGALAHWDLDPLGNRWNKTLTKVCPQAQFNYPSTWWHAITDPRFYLNRYRRYSLRHFQNKLLSERLYVAGLKGIPERVEILYQDAPLEHLVLRPAWYHRFFDRQTVKMILASQQAQAVADAG
ncbi:glycosyltransferase family 2 protein [Motilimonas eburnea]|uniref:glycosyltransferase family 2 protein n=1 Tax=Motilimonas eburnea TaxID=1737488 RepID=UPI001E6587A2|nr:glycosyltransferase family A protein [Motilimonas eburnea]MCE2572199.1 glycosyltransferase family 2 protein [Motilimonas eburnea]